MPMNDCGDCALCCTILGVTAIGKPPHHDCPNCSATAPRCTIYHRRPKKCRDFDCGFRVSPEMPEMFRPDRCHIIITGEDKKERYHLIHVDPKFPRALDTPVGRMLIKIIQAQGKYPSIIAVTGDDWQVIDDNPIRKAMLELRIKEDNLDK